MLPGIGGPADDIHASRIYRKRWSGRCWSVVERSPQAAYRGRCDEGRVHPNGAEIAVDIEPRRRWRIAFVMSSKKPERISPVSMVFAALAP